jgi:hypothetical protein
VLALLVFLTSSSALAIPAFARRYQTSCTTCHVLFPRLNAFGVAFRNNGYRFPSGEEKLAEPDQALGAPAWKRLWPKAMWPGALPATVPLAVRVVNTLELNRSAPAQVDFVFPNEVELLAGGTAGERISYFAELEFVPRRGTEDDTTRLERMFVQFDHLGGTSLANVVVGRFETRAVPFSRFHRRLLAADLLALDYRSPADGFHMRRPQQGIELWGASSGTGGRGGGEYAFGVVNGSGAARDNNTAKDVYGRVAYKFGGFGLTGGSSEETPPTFGDPWSDDSVRLGLSVYRGKGNFADGTDRFWRVTGDIDAYIGAWNLSAVTVYGEDQLSSSSEAVRYVAASIEADYAITSWLVAVLRYEQVSRDELADIRRVVPGIALAMRANLRLVVDWEAYLDTSHAGVRARSGDSQARIRLDIAF